MKQIAPNELFDNFSGFLKAKGITLTEGSYAEGLRKSCSLLTNAINLGQESLERARKEFEKNREHLRQVIHEKTAPKRAVGTSRAKPKPAAAKTKAPSKAASGRSAGKSEKPRPRPKR
jgi:hypothetical protein